MGSHESWMVMADTSRSEFDLAANYALTARDALGGLAMAERHDGRSGTRFVAGTYTRLVQRWNAAHSQSNVWLVLAPGAVQAHPGQAWRPAASLSLMADYETTRVYLGGGWKARRDWGADRATSSRDTWVRAGGSFYTAEYDEVQPWLIVETRREVGTGAAAMQTTTPMLRLIYRLWFVEAGVRTGDGPRSAVFNFMLNY
jgi:hypothetical protein